MPQVSELELFLDISLAVEAVLEGPSLRVRELLSLKAGSVITTRFPAGDNVEVIVGNSRIGAGELTVSGGKVAVRMLGFRGKE